MSILVENVAYFVHDMDLRLPFEFGNVTVTERPLLVVRADVEVNGDSVIGYASDTMLPKWFLKNETYDEALEAMIEVVRGAGDHAVELDPAETVFGYYMELYETQRRWASDRKHPALLWGFGVSLIERAIVDAFCRATDQTFENAVRDNTLGIELGDIYPTLRDVSPGDVLSSRSSRTTAVRHTVGHSDPLSEVELDSDRVDDGLPYTLSEYIRTDGISYFKIKLVGSPESDVERVGDVLDIVESALDEEYAYTVDANEQYPNIGTLREFWDGLCRTPGSREQRLLAIEQPLPRDVAFADDTCSALASWEGGPPIVIDESDGEIDDLATALECGYDGTSHKNCKGVFKGIANYCLIAHYDRARPGEYVMTAEDLINVGPIALLQDLAVVATLGIDHVERNGHHYFRGLEMLPPALQKQTRSAHGDLYREHEDGFPALDVTEGTIALDSVVDAPFGVGFDPDLDSFDRLADRFDA